MWHPEGGHKKPGAVAGSRVDMVKRLQAVDVLLIYGVIIRAGYAHQLARGILDGGRGKQSAAVGLVRVLVSAPDCIISHATTPKKTPAARKEMPARTISGRCNTAPAKATAKKKTLSIIIVSTCQLRADCPVALYPSGRRLQPHLIRLCKEGANSVPGAGLTPGSPGVVRVAARYGPGLCRLVWDIRQSCICWLGAAGKKKPRRSEARGKPWGPGTIEQHPLKPCR